MRKQVFGFGRSLIVVLLLCALTLTGLPGSGMGFARAEEEENEDYPAPDFTLTDQYGNVHTLSDYRGKAVFLNFWATWCPWCVKEMPEIEEIYHELGENRQDVVILGVAGPGCIDTVDEQGIVDFLAEHAWTYPVLMDTAGEMFQVYVDSALPTSWFIRKDGMLFGYVAGAMNKEGMLDAIRQTLEAKP